MVSFRLTRFAAMAAVAAVAGFAHVTPIQAQELRFVHGYPVASQHQRNAEWFAQQVTERSGGAVTFRLFPSAQLMPINQELPAIASGEVALTYSVAPVVSALDPLFGVFDLPFVFDVRPDDIGHAARFVGSAAGGGVLGAALEARGFKLITIAFTDYPSSIYLTKNDAPDRLEDVAGLKIRVAGGRIASLAASAFGYNAVAISGAELVPALSQGVVDGGIMPPIYALDNKLPLKGLMIAPQSWPAVTPLIMSLEKFNELSPENQAIVMQVGSDMLAHTVALVEADTVRALDELRAGGADVVMLSEAETTRWRELAQPVWATFAADNGAPAQQMLDEIARLRAE